MEQDITYRIVKRLIDDMLGRYKIDAAIAYANDREDINIKVGMYETWRELISIELLKCGMIQQGYTRKSDKEIEDLSLYDILELRDFYIKWRGEEEK
jgi:hypothetical protein